MLTKDTGQTLTPSGSHFISWGTTPLRSIGSWSVTWNSAPYYITVPENGIWSISADVWFAAGTLGDRTGYLVVSSYSGREIGKTNIKTATVFGCCIAAQLPLSAGDTVQVGVYFDGAASMVVGGANGYEKMEFMMTRIGNYTP
uniref:Uncharacterized protein n=1 Tax=viral metagenome TaxID=1070528 RepID=A0A6C0LYV8_9ZZZZ